MLSPASTEFEDLQFPLDHAAPRRLGPPAPLGYWRATALNCSSLWTSINTDSSEALVHHR
jgi:hypothetical protein